MEQILSFISCYLAVHHGMLKLSTSCEKHLIENEIYRLIELAGGNPLDMNIFSKVKKLFCEYGLCIDNDPIPQYEQRLPDLITDTF